MAVVHLWYQSRCRLFRTESSGRSEARRKVDRGISRNESSFGRHLHRTIFLITSFYPGQLPPSTRYTTRVLPSARRYPCRSRPTFLAHLDRDSFAYRYSDRSGRYFRQIFVRPHTQRTSPRIRSERSRSNWTRFECSCRDRTGASGDCIGKGLPGRNNPELSGYQSWRINNFLHCREVCSWKSWFLHRSSCLRQRNQWFFG